MIWAKNLYVFISPNRLSIVIPIDNIIFNFISFRGISQKYMRYFLLFSSKLTLKVTLKRSGDQGPEGGDPTPEVGWTTPEVSLTLVSNLLLVVANIGLDMLGKFTKLNITKY